MSDTGVQPTGRIWSDIHADTGRSGAHGASRVSRSLPGELRFPLRAEPTRNDRVAGAPARKNGDQGPLPGGGRGPSRRGDRDGDPFRQARGRGDQDGPCFAIDVPSNGYAWWYVDGVSDCGRYAVSVIAFIGSVFSPWYRWSGRKSPENHCCINVATYGPGGRFAMTDRGRGALRQTVDSFTVGPSSLRWVGGKLAIEVNEVSSLPLISRMIGQILITPSGLTDLELPLTETGSHIWRPFAPTARIDVDLGKGWQWSGHGYFDANFGTRALEQDFDYWTWGRFPVEDGSVCFYDAVRRDGSDLAVGVGFAADGSRIDVEMPPTGRVSRSLWAVRRETRADDGFRPHQTKSMLDAPFYTRSVVRTKINGHETEGVHEALDLNRFRGPWLMPMLAVRVPRRAGWRFEE